jgi:hypothetical protein
MAIAANLTPTLVPTVVANVPATQMGLSRPPPMDSISLHGNSRMSVLVYEYAMCI